MPKLKVLHLISGGDRGGAMPHVFTLLNSLMKQIDVTVICFIDGFFYKEIIKSDIPTILMRQRFRNDLTVISRLVKHIREERYNLIHVHGARSNFIALFLRLFVKLPVVTTVHSDYLLDFTQNVYKKMIYTRLNSFSLRFVDYYIAVSNNFKQMLVERGFDEARVFTVYNALDFNRELIYVSKDEFLSRYEIDGTDKYIVGIIGRLDLVKGHEMFLRTAAEICKQRDDVIFLSAGEGSEQERLIELASELGISGRVHFLGFVEDIFSFINAIDVNVCTSISESFPYMLLEGAIMKKPTVSTAVGGIPELITDGETGCLIQYGDHKAFADAVIRLLNDKELMTSLGENLHRMSKENFSSESMMKRHIDIYENILKSTKDKNKLFDIMMSGYYGSKNSGDEALLSSIISSLRKEEPDIRIIVLSKNKKETKMKYGVFTINKFNYFKIARYMKRSRLLLNGGGSLIQDITSTRSLWVYTTIINLAKKYGLKIMLYANGIGPIIHKRNIATARKALNNCDVITLRDPDSYRELERLSISKSRAILSSDPTLSIEPVCGERIDEIFKREGLDANADYLALSFKDWKFNGSRFAGLMAETISEICGIYHLTPLFVPMQYSADYKYCVEIAGKTAVLSGNKAGINIIKNEYDANETMGILGRAKLVMSMRLHTLIYAACVGKPVIGLVYDPKVRAFMEYINQHYFMEINEANKKELLNMAANIMTNYNAVSESIIAEIQRLRTLSNMDAKIALELL